MGFRMYRKRFKAVWVNGEFILLHFLFLHYYAEANFLFIKNSPVLLNVFRVLDDYRAQKKAGKDPVFMAADLQIYDTDAWK